MDCLWYNKNKPIALSDCNFGFFATRCSSSNVKLNLSYVQTYDFKKKLILAISWPKTISIFWKTLFQADLRSFTIIEFMQ